MVINYSFSPQNTLNLCPSELDLSGITHSPTFYSGFCKTGLDNCYMQKAYFRFCITYFFLTI